MYKELKIFLSKKTSGFIRFKTAIYDEIGYFEAYIHLKYIDTEDFLSIFGRFVQSSGNRCSKLPQEKIYVQLLYQPSRECMVNL